MGLGEWLLSILIVLWLEDQNWIQLHWDKIVTYAVILITVSIGFGVLKQTVKTSQSDIKKLRDDLDHHCDDDDLHLGNRVYALLIKRFDYLDDQIKDLRTQNRNPRK